jgi:alkanesulfonate monooxygenase SsuD/methylene tetrahydromethanopterin reductase-like flavin-dependent oxidoreductase (luciferase family)
MKIGLTLPNRGVLFGVTTPAQMLEMAEVADRSGMASVWVGDSLLAKPRMEAITLLAGVAARTKKVRLGPACMASFSLRDPVLLAYQWASLDLLAEGRSVLVVCTGIVTQEGGKVEGALYDVKPKDRTERMVEWMTLIKRLWTEDNVTFEGKHYRCANVTIEPKPAAKPRPPIWLATNTPAQNKDLVERVHRRVAKHADGWETSNWQLDDIRWRVDDIRSKVREAGRDPASFEIHIYHNININEDQTKAQSESKKFLDLYYTADFAQPFVNGWTATGSPDECVEQLVGYAELGATEVTLRCTAWDQMGQLRRLIDEVMPRLDKAGVLTAA